MCPRHEGLSGVLLQVRAGCPPSHTYPDQAALESKSERRASGVAAGRKPALLSLFAVLGAKKKKSIL